jgi:glutamate carboxypeptidase
VVGGRPKRDTMATTTVSAVETASHGSQSQSAARLLDLRRRLDQMTESLAILVSSETPSQDIAACRTGSQTVRSLASDLLGDPGHVVEVAGRAHLRWRWEPAGLGKSICLIGHYDTVWPLGTLSRRPFSIDVSAGSATGPGIFDMKAGIVQLLYAVSSLEDRSGIEILLTGDEELGSQTSRHLIEETARRSAFALVFEPSSNGSLKVGRKGTGMYRLTVRGRAAHAGLEPEKGSNALTELGHLLGLLDSIARPELGTTVTPTLAAAGTASNVVPDWAEVELDVRVADPGEAERVDRALRSLSTTVSGTVLTIDGGPNRPPLPSSAGSSLLIDASAMSTRLGLGRMTGVVVGGASDGNFTAAVGCPTLDGLGAVGDGAHAEDEYVVLAAMPERAAIAADLIDHLRQGSPQG